jgi:hypothetical protein
MNQSELKRQLNELKEQTIELNRQLSEAPGEVVFSFESLGAKYRVVEKELVIKFETLNPSGVWVDVHNAEKNATRDISKVLLGLLELARAAGNK